MLAIRLGLVSLCTLILATASFAASVSSSRQSCIVSAITAGSAALHNPAKLDGLYKQYFNAEKIARLAAGNYWEQYDDAKKEAQRDRVRQIVIRQLAPNLSGYRGADVRFLHESGSKVKGVLTARHGEKRRVTWHFDDSGCKFINVSVDGLGSLLGLVGKEPLD
jgi:ABC-type transporter MlaC component